MIGVAPMSISFKQFFTVISESNFAFDIIIILARDITSLSYAIN